jgi:hypothetical protein
MVVDPALGVRGGARAGAGLIDDLARGVGAALRGVGANWRAGKAAEAALASRYPGARAPAYFTTPRGGRFVDVLTPAGVALESKVGYTSGARAMAQAEKDAWLLRNSPNVNGVSWVFTRSCVTGKAGPSKPLAQALDHAGIQWWIEP